MRTRPQTAGGCAVTNVVNLNKTKKTRERAAAKAQAAENRIRFGRAKTEKVAAKAEADKALRALDGAKRQD
jgi:hypothetical protein